MKLKMTSITDKGDLEKERIGMVAIGNCDLKYFLVFRTYFEADKGFYQQSENCYWFTPLEVKANDQIILYTRKGKYSVKEKEGATIHFLYWGLNEPIFSEEKDGVVLAEIDSWQLSRKIE